MNCKLSPTFDTSVTIGVAYFTLSNQSHNKLFGNLLVIVGEALRYVSWNIFDCCKLVCCIFSMVFGCCTLQTLVKICILTAKSQKKIKKQEICRKFNFFFRFAPKPWLKVFFPGTNTFSPIFNEEKVFLKEKTCFIWE